MEVLKVTNHPVHIVGEDGHLSPTALIPFCEFGEDGNFSRMGRKSDYFDVPVCNSFRPKIIEDQLCYEVDPNEYINDKDDLDEISFKLYISYNEDREISTDRDLIDDTTKSFNKASKHEIILGTIGKRD